MWREQEVKGHVKLSAVSKGPAQLTRRPHSHTMKGR